ncbi:UNVERIFIED_CONTAM: UDP-glycosyltransferase 88B1 [Sesamum angustifolium]|uniref:Glycosyltransferase n=1 Tax=Sesamum angustifolium TaxID=2727405 RepID=A0AAW2LH84_9LAMI
METVVLYPCPGMGHLISMVELGKFILHQHPSLSINILTAPLHSFNTGSTAAYIRHISATFPSITFHHLPPVFLDLEPFPSMEAVVFEVLSRSNPFVRRALESISLSATISAFIIDLFCTCALPISAQLNIPTYYFTSGACSLAFFLYFPTIHNTTTKSFRDMNALLHVPGISPTPSSDVIKTILDRDTTDYESFLNFSRNLPNSAGIIVNTFESLETRPLKAIREGNCNPGGHTPPVFSIGPLLAIEGRQGGGGDGINDCLSWLDKQPCKSVVYLCFGSVGLFSAAQLNEIAVGLERSGQRFLWVVRSPPSDDKSKRFLPPTEPDLDSLLPAGFLDRTKDQGLVLKSWAPQVAVLNHESVGGFVTHCGWNSVLEAVFAAVPMVAWPLYAEQKMNRVVLVEDMKVALGMEVAEDDFVAAEEVERRVRELMESEKGSQIRKVVEEMSVEAKGAMREGGTSIAALAKLVESWKPA